MEGIGSEAESSLYKSQGYLVRPVPQHTRLHLGEIYLPWRLQLPSALALDQDLGITNLDVVMG